MNDASRYLRQMAQRVTNICVEETGLAAVLLTGSAAEGEADFYSDIDLITYCEAIPPETQRDAVRARIGGQNCVPLGGSVEEGSLIEQCDINGVAVQFGYTTVDSLEHLMADVLERFDTSMPGQKTMEGLLRGVALHGADRIEGWRARASAYPDGLAHAVVAAHLQFFPLWRIQDYFAARDATLWYHQIIVESGFNILGALAGLNRVYYASFQFKRAHKFIDRLTIKPDGLADRLEALFTADYVDAVADLERLVGETVALVETHLPDVDTSRVRRSLGARRPGWTLPVDRGSML